MWEIFGKDKDYLGIQGVAKSFFYALKRSSIVIRR